MKNQALSDSYLISQYVHEGKESALERIIARHKDIVFGHIYKLVRDEQLANDLFQETFIKVVKTLRNGKYNEEGKFLPWVLRIAKNLMIDYYRKDKRMPKVRNTEEFDIFTILECESTPIHEKIDKNATNEELHQMIEKLPSDQREVLWKRMFCDMSFKEIAEETDVSINTALGRMRYALINLRKMMEENPVLLRDAILK